MHGTIWHQRQVCGYSSLRKCFCLEIIVVYSVTVISCPGISPGAHELDVSIGTSIQSSAYQQCHDAMSITALQKKNKKLSSFCLGLQCCLTDVYSISTSMGHHIRNISIRVSGSLSEAGDVLFTVCIISWQAPCLAYNNRTCLYRFIAVFIKRDEVTHDNFVLLENSGLYWHLLTLSGYSCSLVLFDYIKLNQIMENERINNTVPDISSGAGSSDNSDAYFGQRDTNIPGTLTFLLHSSLPHQIILRFTHLYASQVWQQDVCHHVIAVIMLIG